MKVTGIVRRFDDLGRIVIPKEIRKLLFGTPEKSEGMPMEIFMNKDEIIIRKYEENKADDVCEWEKGFSRYVGYPAYYSKCCTTNSKGLEMQTHIISDWKFCPYCGKKIKVIGD